MPLVLSDLVLFSIIMIYRFNFLGIIWCGNFFCKVLTIQHWNKNVILMKFSSMTAHEIATLTTTSAVIDDNLIKMKTIPLQWIAISLCLYVCLCIYRPRTGTVLTTKLDISIFSKFLCLIIIFIDPNVRKFSLDILVVHDLLVNFNWYVTNAGFTVNWSCISKLTIISSGNPACCLVGNKPSS